MKKTISLIFITAVIAVLLPCAVYADNYTTIFSASSYMDGYSKVISNYESAFSKLKSSNANDLTEKYPGTNFYAFYQDKDDIHYFLKDIDNNETPELFIGCKYSKNDSWDSKGLLGMYTYKDGNILYYFADYGDRARFFLLNTGEIFVGGFGGNYSQTFSTYTFSNYELVLNDTITIGLSADKPYEEIYNEWKHNGEIVSSSYANQLLDEKTSQIADVDFKPLSEFSSETASQESGITVLLNGSEMTFDAEPYIESGVTMVPMRAIFEALGAEVSYDSETKTITAVKGSKTIILTVGSTSAYINGELVTMQAPAVISGGYTMVPLRFVSESLDAVVDWNGDTKTITITSN